MAGAALTAGGDGGRAASAPERAASRDGRAVWVVNGCGSCHTFAAAGATGDIGPDLGATLKGMPASYIRESIVAPSQVAAAGYSTIIYGPGDPRLAHVPDEWIGIDEVLEATRAYALAALAFLGPGAR